MLRCNIQRTRRDGSMVRWRACRLSSCLSVEERHIGMNGRERVVNSNSNSTNYMCNKNPPPSPHRLIYQHKATNLMHRLSFLPTCASAHGNCRPISRPPMSFASVRRFCLLLVESRATRGTSEQALRNFERNPCHPFAKDSAPTTVYNPRYCLSPFSSSYAA